MWCARSNKKLVWSSKNKKYTECSTCKQCWIKSQKKVYQRDNKCADETNKHLRPAAKLKEQPPTSAYLSNSTQLPSSAPNPVQHLNSSLPVSKQQELNSESKRFESHLRAQSSGYCPQPKVRKLESDLLNHPAANKKPLLSSSMTPNSNCLKRQLCHLAMFRHSTRKNLIKRLRRLKGTQWSFTEVENQNLLSRCLEEVCTFMPQTQQYVLKEQYYSVVSLDWSEYSDQTRRVVRRKLDRYFSSQVRTENNVKKDFPTASPPPTPESSNSDFISENCGSFLASGSKQSKSVAKPKYTKKPFVLKKRAQKNELERDFGESCNIHRSSSSSPDSSQSSNNSRNKEFSNINNPV